MTEEEREKKIRIAVGQLLDIWDDIPNDVKSDPELLRLKTVIEKIDSIIEEE